MMLTPAESTGSIQEIFWLERVQTHKLTSCACQESKQALGYLSISSQTVLTQSTTPAKYSQDGGDSWAGYDRTDMPYTITQICRIEVEVMKAYALQSH